MMQFETSVVILTWLQKIGVLCTFSEDFKNNFEIKYQAYFGALFL